VDVTQQVGEEVKTQGQGASCKVGKVSSVLIRLYGQDDRVFWLNMALGTNEDTEDADAYIRVLMREGVFYEDRINGEEAISWCPPHRILHVFYHVEPKDKA
jgi:hypothetical protein